MKKYLIKFFCFTIVLSLAFTAADAQKKRAATKRSNTTTKKTTKSKTKAQIKSGGQVDSVAAVVTAPQPPAVDSLPIAKVKNSLRPDEAVETKDITDRTPLPYEHLRRSPAGLDGAHADLAGGPAR